MSQRDFELSANEKALLLNRLQFPLIARDYQDVSQEPDDDARYALHEMLGDLTPTTALLCAATTLQEIAYSHEGLTYLNEFCHGIIDKYGPRVISREDISAADLLPLYADLERIVEIMEMCRMTFELVRPETLVFLDILIPQMESQMMIVDEAMALHADRAPLTKGARKLKPSHAPA